MRESGSDELTDNWSSLCIEVVMEDELMLLSLQCALQIQVKKKCLHLIHNAKEAKCPCPSAGLPLCHAVADWPLDGPVRRCGPVTNKFQISFPIIF